MSQINYKLLQSIVDTQHKLFEVQNHEITANYPTYEEVKSAISNNKIDFNSKTHFVLKQQSKKRFGYMYNKNSIEYIVCLYLKKRIDKEFNIKYPNRNKIIRTLFSTLTLLKNMQDFTIYKFDFKDFFNSISSSYVNQIYIEGSNLSRTEKSLLTQYYDNFRYTFSGLSISNTLCELIARDFDNILKQKLKDFGIIFYQRYIDDGLIISNINMDEKNLETIIEEVISTVFYRHNISIKCKVKLNPDKSIYISKRNLHETKILKYLGYQINFELKSNQMTLSYGMTQEKIHKYQNKLNKLISDNIKSKLSEELLRQKVKAFCHRIVYLSSHKNEIIWKSKGLIANYKELQYHLSNLTPSTKDFLKNAVKNAFIYNQIPLPYYLKSDKNSYTLINTLEKEKSMIFVEHIGYDLNTLRKLAKRIGIREADKLNYNQLLAKYLIALKVGF